MSWSSAQRRLCVTELLMKKLHHAIMLSLLEDRSGGRSAAELLGICSSMAQPII